VLHDRLTGVLCLAAATLAATWGGNPVLHRTAARAAGVIRSPAHSDGVAPAPEEPGTAPAPAAEPTTTGTAAPSSTTTRTPAGAPTTTARPGEPADVLARRALLAPADLPPGFTVTTPAPPDGSAPADTPFERCAGSDAGNLASSVGARARSATFAKADTGSVSSAAVVVDQPATAEKILGLMATAPARTCFEGLINARLARNPNLSQDVRGSLGPAPSPSAADGSLAYRFDVRLPAEDVDRNARPDDPPVRYVADFVLVRKGRTLLVAEFDNLRQPWADAALRTVVANVTAHA
jgi:hypothetical protein